MIKRKLVLFSYMQQSKLRLVVSIWNNNNSIKRPFCLFAADKNVETIYLLLLLV